MTDLAHANESTVERRAPVSPEHLRLVAGAMGERLGAEHYGEERSETAEVTAEQIIAVELKRHRWKEADLKTRPKGDATKVARGARVAGGDDDDGGVDCGAPSDGNARLSESLAVSKA